MSPARRIVVYSIVRVLLFAIPFAVLMLLEVWWWVSAILAAIVATCLSYLFLNRQRNEIAGVVESWRHGEHRDVDNDIENEALDSRDEPGATPPRTRS